MNGLGTARVIHGNALNLPLEDNTVDLVVTSPPYFGLRSYQDAGEHYSGQLGSEATPAEFVDALIAATREMMRVVKPSGSIFVNLGDKYASQGGHADKGGINARNLGDNMVNVRRAERNTTGIPTKSLIGIPWRYALACIDQLGLILRAEIIWNKPNGLPESVTDRVRRSHEQWFHLTLQPRYYSAVDEVREAHIRPKTAEQMARDISTPRSSATRSGTRGLAHGGNAKDYAVANPLGKLPGSVWSVPTQPLTVPPELGVDHFAAFPMEWPRRIITGWSPRDVCTGCGEGRRPVVETPRASDHVQQAKHAGQAAARGGVGATSQLKLSGGPLQRWRAHNPTVMLGYVCGCPDDTTAPTTPGVVLDPFGGTGTTALMAKALGRDGITVDLSEDYCRLARWRTTDRGQLAAALQVDKPAPVDPDQLDLFGEVSA